MVNARVYRCTTAGTSGGSEPTWNTGKASTTTDNDVVWTEVTGNETYGWTAAAPYIQLMISTHAAAGDTVYVSHQHAETATATTLTLTSAGVVNNPLYVLCVNDGAFPPTALATTASVTTTSTNNINFNGSFYMYGITFKPGNEASANAAAGFNTSASVPQNMVFESCVFRMGTGGGSFISAGSATNTTYAHRVTFKNCDVRIPATGNSIRVYRTHFEWLGGSVLSGTTVTTLVATFVGFRATAFISGVDLSILTSSNNLVAVGAMAGSRVTFCGCKLASSNPAFITGTINADPEEYMFDLLDASGSNTRFERYVYQGSEKSNTSIYRTGGASNGVTSYSNAIVTLATGPSFTNPFRGRPIYIWNDAVNTSKTLTVEILHDSATSLTDAEVWVEVEYLGDSSSPKGSVIVDRKADILATAADQAVSTEAWTNSMSNPNKQKLSVTFTPQLRGVICARVIVAKANYTLYYCPRVTVS